MRERGQVPGGDDRAHGSRRRHLIGSALAVLAVTALLAAPAASADTYTVTTTDDGSGACTAGECTLREAVEAANSASEPSTIVVPAGFYGLTDAPEDDSDLRITGEMTIKGAGQRQVTIAQEAECACRVLDVESEATTISGVTITGGEAIEENQLGPFGGDIVFDILLFGDEGEDLLRLEEDTITDGEAVQGGGIYAEDNSEGRGKLEVLNSTVSENFAFEPEEDELVSAGGGILAGWETSLLLAGDTFTKNTAEGFGGGLAVEAGETSIVNSTFNHNLAVTNGGAIATGSPEIPESQPLSPLDEQGPPPLSLRNDTLAGDAIDAESGGAELYDTSGKPLEVVNTIVGPGGGESINLECDLDTDLTSEADIDAGDTCYFENGSLEETDPLLEALAANGGPTETMALKPASPAIDAANGTLCPATDQRGISRPQGAGCDIGAYELAHEEEPAPPHEEESTPPAKQTPSTPAPSPAPVCPAPVTTSAVSFKPKVRPGHLVPGVRVRLATAAPAKLSVKATLRWRNGNSSRTAALGKLSVQVDHWRRVRFPIPTALRAELPLGTRVTVKLRIGATPLGSTGCAATVTNRAVHARVVRVLPHAVQAH